MGQEQEACCYEVMGWGLESICLQLSKAQEMGNILGGFSMF
jgi:hypothetical protein